MSTERSRSVAKSKPFGSEPQTMKVISMTSYDCTVDFPPGDDPFYRMDDTYAITPYAFKSMTPPRTTSGTGQNSLNSLGVWMGASSHGATESDPYQRNFLTIKTDHCGFNSVNVGRFNEGCSDFTFLHQGSNVIEIILPEAPLSKAPPPVVIRPTSMTAAQQVGIQKVMQGAGYDSTNVIWPEQHSTGSWQYIQLPAGYSGSLKMAKHGDYAGWQALLDLGLRPKQCRTLKYKLTTGTRGMDGIEQLETQVRLQQLGPVPGTIPANNLNTVPGPFVGQAYSGGQAKKHQKTQCDWSCQYSSLVATSGDDFVQAGLRYWDMLAQGFDVMPFGNGIVFQFIQYAPPTRDTVPVNTANCQIVPFTINVHNECTFSTRRTSSSNDLYQLGSLPIQLNAS